MTAGNSLVAQWLELGTFTAEGEGSIPGQGTKILQTKGVQPKKKKKEDTTDCKMRAY